MDEGRTGDDGAEITFAPGQDIIPMPTRKPIGDWFVNICTVIAGIALVVLLVIVTRIGS